ncbi:MAG: hypothetical protein P8X62_07185, partial [Flavobacteriaceae bacterium]
LLLAFVCIANICISQNVEIPDQNFEKALIDLGIDSDQKINGVVLKSDVQSVISLDVSNKDIRDLTGIEAFTSLIYLNCRGNDLRQLDLRYNMSIMKVSSSTNNIEINRSYNNSVVMFDKFY